MSAGMYNPYRAVSVRRAASVPECKISQTEDLGGVCYVE